MSVISIDYSDLGYAVSKAQKAENELVDYRGQISEKIAAGLSSLSGSDSQGYISSAIDLAKEKMSVLAGKEQAFDSLAKNLKKLCEKAQNADTNVKTRIEQLARPYEAEMGFFETAGAMLYGLFCVDGADVISKYVPFGDLLVQYVQSGMNEIKHWKEKILDFFRYGDGQYIRNIISAAGEVIGAALAIAGLTLTGSALLLFVGVLAGGIYLLYQFGNFAKTMESNLKALEESWNGNKGMARFYGGVDGISSWIAKNDFGDRYDNRRAEFWGETYDIVGTAAKRLRDMTNLTNNLYSLSNVYGTGENGKKVIVDHDFSVKNIKKNIAEKMNAARLDAGMLYDEKNKKWRWDAFDGKKLLFGSDSSSEGIVKNTKTVMNGWKKVEQWIDGKNENIENIKDFYDSVLSNPEISTGEYHDKLSAAVSGILDIVGKGGFGEYTGTVLNPLADWYEVIAGCIKDLEETDFAW